MATVIQRARTRRAPALVKSIPMAEYLRLVGVNWSSLAPMETSPLKCHDELQNPSEPTATMNLGSAIHCAVLEPGLFYDQYTYYGGVHNGYEWESVKAGADAAGMTVLSLVEWEQCMGAAYAVHRLGHGREARRVMRGCRREVSLFWTDPATGIRCKARPDLLRVTRPRNGPYRVDVLSDIKTTTTVDARKFGRLSADMLYHGKMAFALRGITAAFGRAPAEVSIIAVEQKRPHDIGVFLLDPDVLLAGDELVTKLLHRLKVCRKRGTWPGAYPNVQPLELPSWALPATSDFSDCIEVLS